MISGPTRLRTMVLALALGGTMLAAMPAAAQSQDAEARLRKIEQEVRALQRSVFPGGDGRFFEPEVSTAPGAGTPASPVGPSTSAVTDILGRLDSIEAQLARLTSQNEVNSNDIAMLSSRIEVFEKERNAKLAEQRAAEEAEARAKAEAEAAAAAAPKPPTPERLAAVQAIVKPNSGDAGDDEYVYGFRLWEAKFFPEAAQQLKMFVDKYPSHWRTSYGRNLLGRTFLDDGKPREAAPWLLQNYQADSTGARAADSLLFLADAMVAIGDTNRACIALAEFGEKYPAEAAGRLMQQYEAGRAKVTCN
jgi:TolA-binding protein